MKFNPGGVGKRNAGVGNSPVDNLLVVTLVGETVGKPVVNVTKTVGNVANPVGNVGISRLSFRLSVIIFIDVFTDSVSCSDDFTDVFNDDTDKYVVSSGNCSNSVSVTSSFSSYVLYSIYTYVPKM
jgi:hypothetical protein